MVDYSEDVDCKIQPKRRYRSYDDVEARKRARNASRTDEDWRAYARDVCYRQLAAMDRSTAQLRDALAKRDVPGSIAENVIQAFIGAGLVDDEKFAFSFVYLRSQSRPSSRRSLLDDLRQRGITGELAHRAVDSLDSDAECDSARELARKKLRTMNGLDPEVVRRRMYGALARRGFTSAIIRGVIDEALNSELN